MAKRAEKRTLDFLVRVRVPATMSPRAAAREVRTLLQYQTTYEADADDIRTVSVARAPRRQPTLHEIAAQVSAVAAHRQRIARRLAAIGKPVRMSGKGDLHALAGADMSEPGMHRLTRFDARGPIGHTQYRTLEAAIMAGLQEGYTPTEETP